MNDVILSQTEQGDRHAAAELMPLVYDELRQLASARMAGEKPGQSLDATALVHEGYLKLVGNHGVPTAGGRVGADFDIWIGRADQGWDSPLRRRLPALPTSDVGGARTSHASQAATSDSIQLFGGDWNEPQQADVLRPAFVVGQRGCAG
ncbi:MAG: ECF-type sigma factor [Fuerstiella sp.]